jgi:hypothetical protein
MSDNEQGSPAAQPEVKPENSESSLGVMRGWGCGMLILGCSFDEHQGEQRLRGGGSGETMMVGLCGTWTRREFG